ncbi:MAG: hypothetical protein JNK09_18010 [Prolixibacteraceae bacterium]|nr:hypothetical protein [Prolixibacteraceae bacterium]
MKPIQLIKRLIFILSIAILSSCQTQKDTTINLSGEWELCLDSLNTGNIEQLKFDLKVNLPGTLDEAGIGKANKLVPELKREVMLYLQRKHEYIGKAWYRKTIIIPETETSAKAVLNLERVIWKSTVYVNGKLAGEENSLSVPHQHNLTGLLKPGENELLICIDNSRQFELNSHDMAHAYTNETQIKWNGVLGDFAIHFYPVKELKDIQIFPDYKGQTISVKLDSDFGGDSEIQLTLKNASGDVEAEQRFQQNDGLLTLKLPEGIKTWDEFSPELYTLETSLFLNGKKVQTQTNAIGFREIAATGKNLTINGEPLFLRGTLECAIFPLTGHPPVTVQEWTKQFKSAQAYGLNHIRFHSWCPPRAAFEAADKLGVYLQVEAPNWNTKFGADSASAEFIETEAERIIQTYGNHPSFCFMSMGNELQGDFQRMNNLLQKLKNQDKRHLYTTTTFTFEPGHGKFPEPVDDFFITQYTDSGWVRGQGVFDTEVPNFKTDYTNAVKHLPVPLITHEIGQYSVFPNLKEIEKYTGVLDPMNFKAVKNDLQQKGLLTLANDYLMASGQLAKLLYKEEIERALKTVGISGFQLLDLHDFPGQGTALVGLLDAFWDSKGIVDSTEFKTFCSELVPLIWMGKAVYRNTESVSVEFGVANHFKTLNNKPVVLELIDNNGQVLQKKEITVAEIEKGKTQKLGTAVFALAEVKEAARLTIRLSLQGTSYHNSWSIWVYPEKIAEDVHSDILVTRSFAEAEKALNKGKKVLLNPELKDMIGLEGKFVQVFWSPVHFPNQPGTMGLLIDPKHPAFNSFPTEFHSNWQWWDLCKKSKTLEFGSLPVTPLIRVVDNFFKNRNLTNLFEAKVGNGKLIVSSMDLNSRLSERPEATQLRSSILKYMNSDKFNPENKTEFSLLKNQFKKD